MKLKYLFWTLFVIAISFVACKDEEEFPEILMTPDFSINQTHYSLGDTIVCNFSIKNIKCEKKVEIKSISGYIGYRKIDWKQGSSFILKYVIPEDFLNGEHTLLLRVVYNVDGYEDSTIRFTYPIIVK